MRLINDRIGCIPDCMSDDCTAIAAVHHGPPHPTGDWIQSGFPMSYILMFFTVAAPLFAFLVMATWPVREDLEEKAPLPYQQAAKTYQGMEE